MANGANDRVRTQREDALRSIADLEARVEALKRKIEAYQTIVRACDFLAGRATSLTPATASPGTGLAQLSAGAQARRKSRGLVRVLLSKTLAAAGPDGLTLPEIRARLSDAGTDFSRSTIYAALRRGRDFENLYGERDGRWHVVSRPDPAGREQPSPDHEGG